MGPVNTLPRIEYPERQVVGKTPRGNDVVIWIRDNTSDWNTVYSVMTEDEYELAKLPLLAGLAVDVGAHLGSVSVALAIDNPELRVIAIEAIGENADLIRRNAAENHVEDRVEVWNLAASAPGIKTADVFWRAQGSETVEHHAFIGNSDLVYSHGDAGHETETISCVNFGQIGEPVTFMKIDCEGCEWGFLSDPGIKDVARIHGEWHPVNGHVQSDIVDLLSPSHDVTLTGPEAGPGGFVAVRR